MMDISQHAFSYQGGFVDDNSGMMNGGPVPNPKNLEYMRQALELLQGNVRGMQEKIRTLEERIVTLENETGTIP